MIVDVAAAAAERGWPCARTEAPRTLRVPASRSLPEDALERLPDRARRFALAREASRRGLADVERTYARLTEGADEASDAPFWCRIPGAIVAPPAGIVLTAEREVLAPSTTQGGGRVARALAVAAQVRGDVPRRPGVHVSLVANHWPNYAHWLLDALPRLAALPDDAGPFAVLVPSAPPAFVRDSLTLWGIGPERVVPIDGPVAVDQLLYVQAADRTCRPSPQQLGRLRERFVAAAGAGGGPRRRLYLSRDDGTRRMADDQAVMRVLGPLGFERVLCGALSFAEQVRLFAAAECIVGPHGAALANALFAPPGTPLVEIIDHRYVELAFWRMAALLGHPHGHVFAEPVSEGGTMVDARKLGRIVAQAL